MYQSLTRSTRLSELSPVLSTSSSGDSRSNHILSQQFKLRRAKITASRNLLHGAGIPILVAGGRWGERARV